MPFAEEDYSRKPKDKLWLDGEEMDFGLPKVLVDNSSAVEGFGVEAKSVYDKRSRRLLDNVNVLYVALTRGGAIVCHFKYEFVQKRRSENNMCTFFINYLMNKGVLMQINCIMSLEALQNYRIRQSMLILQKQFV
jgi:hypothetical protein